VAAVFGPRTTLVGAGILGGIVTLAFLFIPGMRDVERTEAVTRASREALVPAEGMMLPLAVVEPARKAPDPAAAQGL
jgi:hypothetical protein